MYIKVVFPIPLNCSYVYSVPDDFKTKVNIGIRVKVNFNNRETYGYVVEIKEKTEDLKVGKIKPILDIIDDVPLINKQLLDLGKWISSYYFSSLGEAFKLMTPSTSKIKEYIFDDVDGQYEEITLTEKQKYIADELKKQILPHYSLIYGITGSGKTEIYIDLIKHFLKKKSRLFTLSLRSRLQNN